MCHFMSGEHFHQREALESVLNRWCSLEAEWPHGTAVTPERNLTDYSEH